MIRVEGLGRSWGDFQLEDIRLDLASGCYCAVVGPCGSGKSLLLETIAGLHPPHRGKVSIDGTDVSRLAPERRRLGYVPQRASIFPHMSVRRNISYAMRYHGVRGAAADERVAELIGLLRPGADCGPAGPPVAKWGRGAEGCAGAGACDQPGGVAAG